MNNQTVFKRILYKLFPAWVVFILAGCTPEAPVTSTITVDMAAFPVAVEKRLYGLNIEEINYAIEGGLYAELIRNRSFEDGVLPVHSAYDRSRGVLVTPNRWTLPFPSPSADLVSGWRRLSANTYFSTDVISPLSDKNRRNLVVSVFPHMAGERGGMVAEGYGGIPLKKGERYDFSFYIKTTSFTPRKITVALEDSTCTRLLSEPFEVLPSYEWRQYRHVFTAQEDVDNATLTVSATESAFFYMDMVSLFPQATWMSRANGLRDDLVKEIAALNPGFIRFPGGVFAEGYTNGTFPVWKESVGPVMDRRHFWNVWGYASSNGMGFHEYLQLCEDLDAEPVYVVNSGITSQSRRPRYEVITEMPKLVQDALDAIAYANSPVDSVLGAMRAQNGHPEPFNLKHIEIGSENYGTEYGKRFQLFKDAINKVYPEVTVISSSQVNDKPRGEWVDAHFYTNPDFFISNSTRYRQDKPTLNRASIFIGELGTACEEYGGTLRAAIGEACFLIGAEEHPQTVKRIAFSPVLGNARYEMRRFPLIVFKNDSILRSPSYHLYKLFASHRGDEIYPVNVQTYAKPNVKPGRAAIELFDDSYRITDVKINNASVANLSILRGHWGQGGDTLFPMVNRWNYVLLGDSGQYNYEFSATIERTKGSDPIHLRIRDNGLEGEQSDHIGVIMGEETCRLYHQAGTCRDTLCAPIAFPFESHRQYRVSLKATDERVECRIDGVLVFETTLKPMPSLVSIATLDKEKKQLLLKVVNTTYHEEITKIDISGAGVKSDIEIIELSGLPEYRNTFEHPDRVAPVTKTHTFMVGMPMVYRFPPNSISLVRIQLD